MKRAPLALTCGDPAGVGPDIIAGWIGAFPDEARDCVLLGPSAWIDSIGLEGQGVGPPDYRIQPGHPDEQGARIAWDAMELAARGCHDGRFSAVVTGPVSKHQLAAVGYPYPGQTEFFADRWGGRATMGFVGRRMRVVLASWHNSLAEVPGLLRKYPEWIQQAVVEVAGLVNRLGVPEPRIAVCGLNPHAGEAGLLGTEERDWIDPLLDSMRADYPGLSKCLPADTVFHRHLHGDFDAVVALYHDQGLGPLKTLEFDTAVNVSLGLAYVRTSPDHGTAFDIAGKGRAKHDSWRAAVELARRLSCAAEAL